MDVTIGSDEARLRAIISDLVVGDTEINAEDLIRLDPAFTETFVIKLLFLLDAEREFTLRFVDDKGVEFTGAEIVAALNGDDVLSRRTVNLFVRRAH
jgi:hypothetical protein